ncbi:hypothetical protein [Maridesulfovibrio ferrireducens]|uniref:hypothetical protein n=1 Tax=Maridesulfovibrio ferrireducens TaxID=246191 RepID=UPI001A20003F|nr:hypothetical protein [Maridesulfovibrio ferrireducens]MBI9112218.1 hypothetical protein [Maridesulfovibrio ferrireducens]
MNDRITKLLGMCLKIDNTTDHSVSFEYSGHCKCVEVYLYVGGWKSNTCSKSRIKICEIFQNHYPREELPNEFSKTEKTLKLYLPKLTSLSDMARNKFKTAKAVGE